MNRFWGLFLGAILILFSAETTFPAEVTYPTKPVKIIVGWEPGGQADTLARTLADFLEKEKYLGKPMIVENRAGGASGVAAVFVAKAKADGYMLGAISDSPLVRVPHMRKVPYHPLEDLIPVVRTNVSISGVTVKADSPFKTFQDMIEYAKKNPGKLSYGHPGSGSSPHLGMGAVGIRYGLKFSSVPFKGEAPLSTAMLGGHVMVGAWTTGGFGPFVKSGDLRVLALFSRQRIKLFPDAPAILELGGNVTAETNFLIVAPKGTPPEVLDRLKNASARAMTEPGYGAVADKFWTVYEPILTGEDLKKRLKEDYEYYGDIIKKLDLRED